MSHRFFNISRTIPLSLLVLVTACSSGRDVSVTGEVTASAALAGDHAVRVEFYEPPAASDGGTAGKATLVDSVTLQAPGKFDAKVSLEGSSLRAIAIVDLDGDETCTAGEPWGEVDVPVAKDDTAVVTIAVTPHTACPTDVAALH